MPSPVFSDLPPANLAAFLKIPILPLVEDKDPFRQLEYIRDYVEALGCSCMLIEESYVDRDYMQDHSAFYAASFASYGSQHLDLHPGVVLPNVAHNLTLEVDRLQMPFDRLPETDCVQEFPTIFLGLRDLGGELRIVSLM